MQRLQRLIRWFLPAEGAFFDYVEAAAVATDDAAQRLLVLCQSPLADWPAHVEGIRDAEHAGDKAMRDMADALDRTFVTPLDREDLYALTSAIESVSDVALATATQAVLHRVDAMPEGALELATILAQATATIRDAAPLLRTGNQTERIRQDCATVERLEHEADLVYRRVIGDLFVKETDAIRLLKHKEFVEGLEDSVDRCASVARVLEGILIKNG